MIVQIYGLTRAADVRAIADAGVDHFGFAVDVPPADVSPETARELMDLVPADAKSTALATDTEVGSILETVRAVEPDVLHVCSATDAVTRDGIREIRSAVEFDLEIEKSIEVSVEDPVEAALRYDDVSDYLLVDSPSDDEDIPGVGVTGETHDWSISSRIVDAVETPVILAGGLSPANVADAIREVRPAGVDSYTQTSETMRKKDPELVEAFARTAKQAAERADEQ